MITDEDKERVRQATDMLQLVGETVELRQKGHDWWGCCPFHHEKSPSFHVNPTTGLWKCFGCGEGGDVFAYVMKRESLSFPDAIRYLADRAGIELSEERGRSRRGPKRARLMDCMAEARDYYELILMRGRGEGPDAARRYLAGRGFGSDVCKRWHLGYAGGHGALVGDLHAKGFTDQEILGDNLATSGRGGIRDRFFDRVMFPICDEQGHPIAFGGRVLTDAKPKYLNTTDTPIFKKGKHLFAFDRAKDAMVSEGTAIVCEGYTDVISMHEAGFTNAVAALGTALTLDHVRMIERFAKRRIICMFDGDAAGQRAAERSLQFVDKTALEFLCVVLPGGQDPAEFLADHGADELRKQLDGARPLVEFVFRKRLEGYDLDVPGQRAKALDDLAGVLAPLKGSLALDEMAQQLAGLTRTDKAEVLRRVNRKASAAASRERAAQEQKRRYQDRSQAREPAREADPFVDYYGPEPFSEGGYPEPEPYGQTGPVEASLSADELRQLSIERELLAMMTTNLDLVRPYGERIGGLNWVDARDEAMACAMLATPPGTDPQQLVLAAQAVVPEAGQILASGTLEATSDLPNESKVEFLVDMMDLWTSRQQVRRLKAELSLGRSNGVTDEGRALFEEATKVQKHINELQAKLPKRV